MSDALMVAPRPLTAIEIRAQVNLIQEVMQAVMKKDTHYGTIPGCKKPSLWKPGAEVLFTTFRISVDPIVEDLSTPEEARFRVTARAHNHDLSLGSAVGEASSDEEKYKWRQMVCQEEYDDTPEDRRRTKWKDGRNGPYCVQQIRTEVADHRNTILKMAAKRAYVALALQVTAASDIFTQDIEDLPAELQTAAINGDAVDAPAPLPTEIKKKESAVAAPAAPSQASAPTAVEARAGVAAGAPVSNRPVQVPTQPAPRPQQARPPIQSPKSQQVRTITEPQSRRLYAIWKQAGVRSAEAMKEYLQENCGVTDSRQIPAEPKSLYENAVAWAEGKEDF